MNSLAEQLRSGGLALLAADASCVFHAKWPAIPRDDGHPEHGMMAT